MSSSESSGRLTAAPDGRRAARKRRTRSALVAAAQRLVADGGPDAVTIEAVTDAADVGFGTFYGYFASKEALLDAAVADAAAALGAVNDALTASLDDPAEVMAAAIRHTIGSLDAAPRWARFVTGLGFAEHRQLSHHLGDRLRRDLAAGQAAGRFAPDPLGRFPHLIQGMVLAAVQARVDGELGPEADACVAADVLRLLGLPGAEADEVARRPLPALRLDGTDGTSLRAHPAPGAEDQPGGSIAVHPARTPSTEP